MIFSQLVLNWFHFFGRKNLPWQKQKNLYNIWISEIMLQQTQVKIVVPYFKKFIKTFPNIKTLANSSLKNIMYVWSGLGYYTRARNLHKTSKIILEKYNGIFPDNFNVIINFPGIGKTTAGAILSFALGSYFSILDSNVKRVLLRFYLIKKYIKNQNSEKKLWKIIELITPIYNTDKFNQAIMDIGSLICTIKQPKCHLCPLNYLCLSYKNQIWLNYKIKKNTKSKINKTFLCTIIRYKDSIFLEMNKIYNLWNSLFILPMFEKKTEMLIWFKKNQLDYKKTIKLKSIHCILSNYSLKININIINIKSKKEILKKKSNIWYKLFNPQSIGIPKPIDSLLKQLK
ncbi:Adenine DNA glycosylase [Buchnera aphidicola (Eriosoma grossulariae)]|uniref:A/G-specific adenine glycosylase n=1 Tax=Buchnera aphidicola TaxID=9 RepID=UPI003463BAC0